MCRLSMSDDIANPNELKNIKITYRKKKCKNTTKKKSERNHLNNENEHVFNQHVHRLARGHKYQRRCHRQGLPIIFITLQTEHTLSSQTPKCEIEYLRVIMTVTNLRT